VRITVLSSLCRRMKYVLRGPRHQRNRVLIGEAPTSRGRLCCSGSRAPVRSGAAWILT
jgi:hypothetical protein